MGDSLGDRMKAYEINMRFTSLEPGAYMILRVDGRAFHTYLRGALKPYDPAFAADMGEVAVALCREVCGAQFAYGQSDEISVVIANEVQPWFGGALQKMVSVAAGVATAALINQRGPQSLPHFDARVFTLPSAVEVGNYLIWRQQDAVRNSISMAAQAKFSHKQIYGANVGKMRSMLWVEHHIDWNDYPEIQKRGFVVCPNSREAVVSYVDKRTGDEETVTAMRTFWDVKAAPQFTLVGGFLPEMLNLKEAA